MRKMKMEAKNVKMYTKSTFLDTHFWRETNFVILLLLITLSLPNSSPRKEMKLTQRKRQKIKKDTWIVVAEINVKTIKIYMYGYARI